MERRYLATVGTAGALIAHELACPRNHVVVLNQRVICWDSTSASTAVLQYAVDSLGVDLATRYDQDSVLLA